MNVHNLGISVFSNGVIISKFIIDCRYTWDVVVTRERIHSNKYTCAGKVNMQTSPDGIQLAQKHLNNNGGKKMRQKFNNKKIHNMKYVIRQCFDSCKIYQTSQIEIQF
jgi:hypothetical protein